MKLDDVIALARKHQNTGMASSARVAASDAEALRESAALELHRCGGVREAILISARARALASLRYSVGVFHPDYIEAAS